MHICKIVVFLFIVVGGESGLVRRQITDTLTASDALTNHTSAIIETVLQNIHRMKNFEERERLERLVTRFKMLVQELQTNVAPAPDGATDLSQAEESLEADALNGNRLPSEQKWKNTGLYSHNSVIEVSPNGHYPNKLFNLNLKSNTKKMDPETARFHRFNKTMTTTAKPSLASPISPSQQPTEASKGNASTEAEEDDDSDDVLVQELHQKTMNEKVIAFENDEKMSVTSTPQDELITVAQRHRIENDDDMLDDDLNSSQEDDEEEGINDRELQDDLKLLNKVIGKLREVKALLRRLRGQGAKRR